MKGYIEIGSPKGGTGTTLTACAVALSLENMGHKVLLVDTNKNKDVRGVFAITDMALHWQGIDVLEEIPSSHRMPNSLTDEAHDYVVVDAGNEIYEYEAGAPVFRIGVIRNEYLSLRSAVEGLRSVDPTYDIFACHLIQSNVLTKSDVSNVLDKEVIFTEVTDKVSRAVDAGLFTSRWKDLMREWSDALVGAVMAVTP